MWVLGTHKLCDKDFWWHVWGLGGDIWGAFNPTWDWWAWMIEDFGKQSLEVAITLSSVLEWKYYKNRKENYANKCCAGHAADWYFDCCRWWTLLVVRTWRSSGGEIGMGSIAPCYSYYLIMKRLHNFFPSPAPPLATNICNKIEAVVEENLIKILARGWFTLTVLDILQVLTCLILITMLCGRVFKNFF